MDAVLELRKLSKSYANHQVAVSGVSLTIQQGEFFSLVGPSGCGKTTTLRLIAGFEEPTDGDVLLKGVSLRGLPPYARNVSTVFQNYALFPHMTVRENIGFGLRRKTQMRAAERQKRVADALEMV